MSKTVLIGCKLPNGLTVYGTEKQAITLNGLNTCLILGGFGVTHVDENEASYIFAAYADHAAFQNNAVFTTDSGSVNSIVDLADELKDEETGLEGLDPANPGKKGQDGDLVKPADNQKLPTAENRTVRVKKVGNAADKAAAAEVAALLAV